MNLLIMVAQVAGGDESKFRSHLSVQLRRPEVSGEDTTQGQNSDAPANSEANRAAARPVNLQVNNLY